MKTTLFALAVLASLTASACASPAVEDTAADSAELAASGPALRLEATWSRVVTGTPTIGFDATTPRIALSLRVDDAAIRRDRPGFDGLERPRVLIPRADGETTQRDLPFRYTTHEGFIELHPVDVYDDALLVTEPDLARIQERGISLVLETNAGEITTHAELEPRHAP